MKHNKDLLNWEHGFMHLITIFTPTYNRSDLLNIAYDSLVRQKNKDFLWLIVDDGSTDNTEEIVSKWISDKLPLFFRQFFNRLY